jgi:N-acetylneuraminate synthase
MSSYAEIAARGDAAARARRGAGAVPMHLALPGQLEEVGLNVIGELRKRFDCRRACPIIPARFIPRLAAMAQGADMIEAHIVFDKTHVRSGYAGLAHRRGIQTDRAGARDAMAQMLAHPVDKDPHGRRPGCRPAAMFGKSVCARAQPCPAGTTLARRTMLDGQEARHGNAPSRRNRLSWSAAA